MSAPTARRAGRRLARLALAVTASVALVLGFAPSAWADLGNYDGSNGFLDGNQSTGGGGNNGNNGGTKKPGGGGGSTPGCMGGTFGFGCTFYSTNMFPPGRTTYLGMTCPKFADGRMPTSATSWTRVIGPNTTVGGYWCNYPPPPVVTRLSCSWSANVTITGPSNNGLGVPPATTNNYVASPFQGNKTVANCRAPINVYNIRALTDFGKYSLIGAAYKANCTRTQYPQSNIPDRWSCSAPYRVSSIAKQAQMWCGGWETSWTQRHRFDFTDCNGPGGSWQCVQSAPLVNGSPAARAQIQKGQITPLTYSPLQISGDVKNLREVKWPTYSAKTGSTPNKPDVSDPNMQVWEVKSKSQNEATIKFWMASNPDEGLGNFVLQRSVRFSADFLLTSYNLTRFDPITGQYTVIPVQKWVAGQSYCGQDQAMDVFRARLSN